MNDASRFYGKYRGTVVNNADPQRIGRVQVTVSDIPQVVSSWAMPCVPLAGLQTGMYMIPPVGAGVWVEFEQGDPDHPIYVGGWWGSVAEVPATASVTVPGMPVFVLQSQAPSQNAIVVSDVPVPPMLLGGIMLKAGTSSVTVDPSGVTITAPKIQVNGLTIVNNGALTVTL
jgi:hypothetical protein